MDGDVWMQGLTQVHVLDGDVKAVSATSQVAQKTMRNQTIAVGQMVRQQVRAMWNEDAKGPAH
jgi:hypothetical protein